MNVSYQTKFKDRLPQETINIITDFFTKRGYRIVVTPLQSECGTWSCVVKLYYKNQYIQYQNGKGVTKEYAIASGLAELYERFCNIGLNIDSKLADKKIKKFRQDNFGYQYEKDEKLIDTSSLMHYDNIKNLCTQFSDKILDYIAPNPVGIPYTNIITNDIIYLDKRIDFKLGGSNGMTAGNTYDEAFNQGMAELAERMVIEDFFSNEGKYYILNNYSYIKPELIDIINKIKENNMELYIIDCSYNLNLPVVGIILVDKYLHRTRLCFGSFPEFNIALERCITEIYQNLETQIGLFYTDLQTPARHANPIEISDNNFCNDSAHFHYMPEHILNKLEIKDNINSLFLFGEYSNAEIKKYWINIIKEKKLDIYVHDNSLMKDMSALKLICMNKLSIRKSIDSPININLNWDIVNRIYQEHLEALNLFEIYDFNKFYKFYERSIHMNQLYSNEFQFVRSYLFGYGPEGIITQSNLLYFERYLNDIQQGIDSGTALAEDFEHIYLNKYLTIARYKRFNKYSDDEIKSICKLLGIDITNEDLIYYKDKKYLLENIYYKPLYNLYNSDLYQEILMTYLTEGELNELQLSNKI